MELVDQSLELPKDKFAERIAHSVTNYLPRETVSCRATAYAMSARARCFIPATTSPQVTHSANSSPRLIGGNAKLRCKMRRHKIH